ncbi:PQQ-binding-like beta-propeller repeat protein, partial [Shewanella xiamenensis]
SVGVGVGDYYSRLTPAVSYGKIFAGDRYGEVVAFDEETGEQVWKKHYSEEFRDNDLAKNKGARLDAGVTPARNKLF